MSEPEVLGLFALAPQIRVDQREAVGEVTAGLVGLLISKKEYGLGPELGGQRRG